MRQVAAGQVVFVTEGVEGRRRERETFDLEDIAVGKVRKTIRYHQGQPVNRFFVLTLLQALNIDTEIDLVVANVGRIDHKPGKSGKAFVIIPGQVTVGGRGRLSRGKA